MLALVAVALFPLSWLLGNALILIVDHQRAKTEYHWEDRLLAGIFMLIGLAEGAHLGALVRGQSVSAFTKYYFLLLSVAGALSCVISATCFLTGKKQAAAPKEKRALTLEKREIWILAAFLVLAGAQLFGILFQTKVYLDYDLTLETVTEFLRADRLYGANPMTGLPYEQGMPSRLKILCLPTLYAFLTRNCHVTPEWMTWHFIPAVTLAAAYLAYLSLARALFPKERFLRLLFLAVTALLLIVGDYGYGMEGFGLLHAGFQGTTIRGAVLMPYLIGLCLRKKWRLAPLVILTEVCLVWTLYGLGMGIAVTAIFLVLGGIRSALLRRKEGRT